jgi:dihydrofolate synthase/folylpolyglutamate synthase
VFTNFRQTEAYLNRLVNYERAHVMPPARGRPDFSRVLSAIKAAHLWRAPPLTVHIAGTKGKGSTLLYLEALLASTGRVVSFMSPHLLSVRERVRVSQAPVKEQTWLAAFNALYRVLERSRGQGNPLTYFETIFLVYLWTLFHRRGDVALVEVGLGGTYDCTNILTPTVSILTPIDYDHTEILGRSLAGIARDKAGIIKPKRPVVISRQRPTVQKEIQRAAADRGCLTMRLGKDFDWQEGSGGRWHYEHRGEVRFRELQLRSSAKHQRDNAATALCAAVLLEKFGQHLTAGQVRRQLAGVHLPGRLELFPSSPPVLLDVAHNPASFRALTAFLNENFHLNKILLISGILEQKDYRACLKHVLPQVEQAIFVRLSHPRSRSPLDLATFASSLGVSTQIVETEEEAFERMRHRKDFDLAVIAGSFTLAGAYLAWRKAESTSI